MKVPTWAIIIGIIMILFGGCGALNNIQKIYAPKTLDQQSDIMSQISKSIEKDMEKEIAGIIDSRDTLETGEVVVDSSDMENIEKVKDTVMNMLNVSDYYKKWIVIIGIVGTIAALIYAIGGIFLIMGKSFAVRLAYTAIGLSMASLVFQIVILSLDNDSGFISMASSFGSYFVLFINIILIVIILASDKSYFYQNEILEDS